MYTTSSRVVRDLLIHSSYVHAEVGRVKDACFVRGGPDPVQSIGINRRPSPSHSIPTVSQPKGVLFVRSAFLTCLTYMPTWTLPAPLFGRQLVKTLPFRLSGYINHFCLYMLRRGAVHPKSTRRGSARCIVSSATPASVSAALVSCVNM